METKPHGMTDARRSHSGHECMKQCKNVREEGTAMRRKNARDCMRCVAHAGQGAQLMTSGVEGHARCSRSVEVARRATAEEDTAGRIRVEENATV